MYLKFLKANFKANFGTHNSVKMCGKISSNIENNLRKKEFESFEEICMYSKILRKLICWEILRKFRGTVRKLLKQKMLRKLFLYFGNIFRNNCVIRNFK